MPQATLMNLPPEMRRRFEEINAAIKRENPNMPADRRARIVWEEIKREWYQDRQGKWHKRKKKLPANKDEFEALPDTDKLQVYYEMFDEGLV